MLVEKDINSPIKILLLGGDSEVGEVFLHCIDPLAEFDVTHLSTADLLQSGFSEDEQQSYDCIVDAVSLEGLPSKQNMDIVSCYTQWASKLSIRVLMFSSVEVFSGLKGSNYSESDEPDSQTKAGKVLAQVEEIVLKNPENIVLRSGWLFGGKSFSQKMEGDFIGHVIRQAKNEEELDYSQDVLGCPTPVEDLIRVGLSIIKQRHYGSENTGIYHYCCAEEISWMGYAKAILMLANQYDPNFNNSIDMLNEDSMDSVETVSEPVRLSLSCREIFNHFGVKQRPWRLSLKNLVKELYQIN